MLLEIIATTLDDAVTAEQHGADRLELITAMNEGGLTPSIGLIEQVVKAVQIPVHVMVRPHSRSFVYSERDKAVMAADIQAIREAGAAGVVFGMLTPEGNIDEALLEQMLKGSGDMQVTFHRAFDKLGDQAQGLQLLMKYKPVTRVLTSGGPGSALHNIPQIRKLVEMAKASGTLDILAGSGLNRQAIQDFVRQTGVNEVHFGSAVRYEHSGMMPIDPAELRLLADSLHR
ncbi:copper homeostasis protein CutC [Paenibacillus lemnae]|uniref:PF03932 family protein CutC n=1 Tax=Paenibacillus lemnae TaxID=1330551 RepID=A0A848M5F0_PAELE|nr:copper homeostasis protein CutC [Paenibacillus lemnae]NMO96348.1 copper homeostasis protein CutC [Paenibacillus lemnae]